MTLEELKKEAGKLGYKLKKKPEKVTLLPCRCGRKRPSKWCYSSLELDGYVYVCPSCGLEAPPARTIVAAKKAWNKAVQDENKT